MTQYHILPKTSAQGVAHILGSKSLSNRILLIASLAEGKTSIRGLLQSEDTQMMLDALGHLGVKIQHLKENRVEVKGTTTYPNTQALINVGNAGTVFRPLVAVLSAMQGCYEITGCERLCQRPIQDLVQSLVSQGANIEYLNQHGFAPLKILTGHFSEPLHFYIQAKSSSQFISALLIAAPIFASRLNQEIRITHLDEYMSKPYVQMTCDVMRLFGVQVLYRENTFYIPKNAYYHAVPEMSVEPDFSSASYFMALGLIGGGTIELPYLPQKSMQGDYDFIPFLKSLGAKMYWKDNCLLVSGICVSQGERLPVFDWDFQDMPDVAMTAAVLALYAQGPCILRNIASWKYKETDRLSAMYQELSKLGAVVEKGDSWIRITPPSLWTSAILDTYNDHRMAMSLSLACFGGVPITLLNPECTQKTFPTYFREFEKCLN